MHAPFHGRLNAIISTRRRFAGVRPPKRAHIPIHAIPPSRSPFVRTRAVTTRAFIKNDEVKRRVPPFSDRTTVIFPPRPIGSWPADNFRSKSPDGVRQPRDHFTYDAETFYEIGPFRFDVPANSSGTFSTRFSAGKGVRDVKPTPRVRNTRKTRGGRASNNRLGEYNGDDSSSITRG